MDFTFLFDSARKLFSIGYRVSAGTLDPGRYDLLASEARLTSFLTIARGDVPVSHWFRLGRALTPVESDSVLVSWSGSMFEYLMPALVMRVPAGSLLAQTGDLAVRRQISYGAERGVPWGVSESGYFVRDLEMTYQYSNFGVPGLGLRRGLGEDVAGAAPRGDEGGHRPDVHGAPPGHAPRRAGEHAAGGPDARALPRRAEDPGDRAPAPGTNAAERRRRPAPRRGGERHRRR